MKIGKIICMVTVVFLVIPAHAYNKVSYVASTVDATLSDSGTTSFFGVFDAATFYGDLNDDPNIGEYLLSGGYSGEVSDGVLAGPVVDVATTILNNSDEYGDLIIFDMNVLDYASDEMFRLRMVLRDSSGTMLSSDRVTDVLRLPDYDAFIYNDLFSTGLFTLDSSGNILRQAEFSGAVVGNLPVPSALLMFIPALGLLAGLKISRE